MTSIELVVLLGALIVAGTLVADRLAVASPMVLLLLGIAVGFLPGLRPVRLPPDVVLVLFLPALLFWESLTTSVREIRANLRPIMLLSIGLVIATAATVAAVAHAVGLTWPMSWVLGAVVAPTDATALSALSGRLPRRTMTTLKAESLINDGTALVIYAVAIGVATGRQPASATSVTWRFVAAYVGGVAVGVAIQYVVLALRRVARRSTVENSISVLTPFLAYLPAELLHVSGVVAVVSCGLLGSHYGPRLVSAETRREAVDFWRVTTFILNAALFVLIGLQLRPVLAAASDAATRRGVILGVVATGAVIGARLCWMYTVPYVIRALDRRPAQRLRRVGARHRLPSAWAGFRGAVSLAAALAVPMTRADGQALPDREVVILATLVVIVATLVLQGSTLAAVLRWARLPEDATEQQEQRHAEKVLARTVLETIERRAAEVGADGDVTDRIRAEYQSHLVRLLTEIDRGHAGDAKPWHDDAPAEQVLRAALVRDKRQALLRLRAEGTIDDIVLRRIQAQLDAEEVRLTGASHAD